jgi:recombination protein RecA
MSTLATISSLASVGAEFAPAVIEKKSTALKHIAQSERLAGIRPASRLEVRPRPEMLSSGIPELDALAGGIPRGCLTEVCGTPSSGKTSVLLATLAAATQRSESCVLIDASDSFNPGSGAAAGIDFGRLLWVRCRTSYVVRRTSYAENQSSVVGRRSLAKNPRDRVPHPSALFAEGGDFDSADDVRRTTNDGFKRARNHHEYRLEQVLKSTDLILQSGGFGLVALDLAGIPEKFVRRIPLASWFRFQRAVEHTKTALLVISEIPCAQTCAALVMKVWDQASGFSRQASGRPSHTQLLKELRFAAEVVRSRLDRKPMQSMKTSFTTHAVRAG